MGVDFPAWDEAIKTRLQPIQDALASIPIAAIPQEAGKYGDEQFESIDWLFPEYSANSDGSDRVQQLQVDLIIRLHFSKRYASNPQEKAALEWAEQQILLIIPGYRLPDTLSPLRLVSGRLFAPRRGQWYKELRLEFSAQLVPTDEVEPIPPVITIGVDDAYGQLVEVTQ